VECLEDGTYCAFTETCPTYDIWKGANELLKDYFDRITLKDAVVLAEKKDKKSRPKAR
jgi:DNA-binding IscR family transcriptional regulator